MENGMRHFELRKGNIYDNAGGGSYKCSRVIDSDTYEMVNIRSGWTFLAHVITIYRDGCIEWDYSTKGYFA